MQTFPPAVYPLSPLWEALRTGAEQDPACTHKTVCMQEVRPPIPSEVERYRALLDTWRQHGAGAPRPQPSPAVQAALKAEREAIAAEQ